MDLLQVLPYILLFIFAIIIIALYLKVKKSGFKIISLGKKLNSERQLLFECNNKLNDCDGSYSKYSGEKGVGTLGVDNYAKYPKTVEQSFKQNPFKNSKKVEMRNTIDGNVITFKSIRDASKQTNLSRYRIEKSCKENGSITHGTFFFKYAE